MRPAWQPVLNVTPQRIRLAKILFGLSILNFLLCVGVAFYGAIKGDSALRDKGPGLILTSLVMLQTIYIAIHWAFRPENLFSPSLTDSLEIRLENFFLVRRRSRWRSKGWVK